MTKQERRVQHLRDSRIAKELSQAEIGRLAKINRATISLLECGHLEVSDEMLDAIEQAIGTAFQRKLLRLGIIQQAQTLQGATA